MRVFEHIALSLCKTAH